MVRVVLVAFATVSLSSAFPFTPPEQITSETKGVAHASTGIPLRVIPEPVKKTEFQNSGEVFTEQVKPPEKAGIQVSSEVYNTQPIYNGKNKVVSNVQSSPVGVEHVQPTYTESPVLLPIQPLSVVNQENQVWRPIVVPAEAIADGRVIIAAAQPIQQRSFSVNPVPGPVQVEPYSPSDYVQSVDVQTPVQQVQKVQPTVQEYTSDQVDSIKKSLVDQNQVPVEPNHQVYSAVPNVQPVVTQVAEQQYTPDEIQSSVKKQQPVIAEQQVYQQNNEGPLILNQNNQVPSSVVENVKQQASYQFTTENVEPNYYQHQVSKAQVPHQEVGKCSQVQNVESVVATKTENQQQYQQVNTPVQAVETQTYQVQTIEKQVPHQQPVQVQAVEPVNQQFQGVQFLSGSVTEYNNQFQTAQQTPKSSEGEQEVYVHPAESYNSGEDTVHNFGDKISQVSANSVQVVQSQVQPVNTVQK